MRPDELVALLRHIARLETAISTLEGDVVDLQGQLADARAKDKASPEPAP